MKHSNLLLGGHVSAAGGLYKAIDNAEAIGATAIQLFGASPRQWFPKLPTEEDYARFKERRAGSMVKAVYLHAPYLINLASPEADLRKKSVINLATHLAIAEGMGADGVIFHVGSGKGMDKEKALALAAEGMNEVLDKVSGTVPLVIENAAGGGDKIGRTPEEIGALMRLVGDASRIETCYDTAHGFEAGIIDEYTPEKTKALFDTWEKEVGEGNLVALHINDSKTACGSCNDRHENLGDGHIGMEAFRVLATEKRLHKAAWLLEVPGIEGNGPDGENMERLRGCF